MADVLCLIVRSARRLVERLLRSGFLVMKRPRSLPRGLRLAALGGIFVSASSSSRQHCAAQETGQEVALAPAHCGLSPRHPPEPCASRGPEGAAFLRHPPARPRSGPGYWRSSQIVRGREIRRTPSSGSRPVHAYGLLRIMRPRPDAAVRCLAPERRMPFSLSRACSSPRPDVLLERP
jgi:hypothetical protein